MQKLTVNLKVIKPLCDLIIYLICKMVTDDHFYILGITE